MAQEADRLLDVALPGFQNGAVGEPLAARCRFGSPPRVRGKHAQDPRDGVLLRLTPACAGKTASPGPTPPQSSAHPRACGENPHAGDREREGPGSSPRIRGKPRRTGVGRPHTGLIPAHAGKQEDDLHELQGQGLIPAHAGKTSAASLALMSAWAHPGACGENGLRHDHHAQHEGSSPRVRGKLQELDPGRARRGLIPACAGKTTGGGGPRPRGGSSPRVRGKPIGSTGQRSLNGLIPACAGKTDRLHWTTLPRRAHPRVCGENAMLRSRGGGPPGSSPRVRGKHGPHGLPARRRRLIPARAGKTARRLRRAPTRAAHPRACGENRRRRAGAPTPLGSSPRVRGKRFLTWAFTARVGRILETLEPSAFSGSYSFPGARANGGQCRARRRGLCTGPALGRALGAS